MLATAWPKPFSDPDWSFEPKWDGIRAILTITPGGVTIHGRRGVDITQRYPELLGVRSDREVVVDGEIVAFVDGSPSFERLQSRMHLSSAHAARRAASELPATLMAFDLLHDGSPLVGAPLIERRMALGSLAFDGPIEVSPAVDAEGEALWAAVVERNLEGIVAKRLGSSYRPGVRSADWRKIVHVLIGEAVVGGFTAGEGARRSTFGALLLGRWQGDRLRFVGSVGTGFREVEAKEIRTALDAMRIDECPFRADPGLPIGAVWVEPTLVASIGYRDRTAAGRFRHPRFRGFTRDDPSDLQWEESGTS